MLGNHPEFARCTEQLASMMQSPCLKNRKKKHKQRKTAESEGMKGLTGLKGLKGFSQHKIHKSSVETSKIHAEPAP